MGWFPHWSVICRGCFPLYFSHWVFFIGWELVDGFVVAFLRRIAGLERCIVSHQWLSLGRLRSLRVYSILSESFFNRSKGFSMLNSLRERFFLKLFLMLFKVFLCKFSLPIKWIFNVRHCASEGSSNHINTQNEITLCQQVPI